MHECLVLMLPPHRRTTPAVSPMLRRTQAITGQCLHEGPEQASQHHVVSPILSCMQRCSRVK